MTPEERVLIVLKAPARTPLKELAGQIGLDKSTIHKIKTGKLYAGILPEIPRKQQTLRQDRSKRCWHCRLATTNAKPSGNGHSYDPRQWCSLDVPEAMDPKFAIECPSFVNYLS
jgi:hypothetical protein